MPLGALGGRCFQLFRSRKCDSGGGGAASARICNSAAIPPVLPPTAGAFQVKETTMKQTAFGSRRDGLVSYNTAATGAAISSTGMAVRALLVSLVAIAALCPGATHAIGRILPQDVKDLSAGPRTCTGRGVYAYTASWTPVMLNGRPVLSYTPEAHNCVTGPVRCTASRCTVQATSCRVGAPGPWFAVRTTEGSASASGPRVAAAPSSHCN
jgi:hypothetical protein